MKSRASKRARGVALTPAELIHVSLLAWLGRLRQTQNFVSLAAAEAWIETRRRWVKVSMDGEVARLEMPLRYRTRPAALRVIVPEKEIASEPYSIFPMCT